MDITYGVVCTLRSEAHHPPIVFGISPYASNAMKSSNPHSGIYEAETSRTLDLNGGNPACNQGGMIVLAAIEGNGSRPSHQGAGINDGDVMYTLNGTEVHGVVYEMVGGGASMDNNESKFYDKLDEGQGTNACSNGLERRAGDYIARRLTPTECARLQGFPDDWCADVPHSDSAEYKLWGNGIALPCLLPMMKAMKQKLQEE